MKNTAKLSKSDNITLSRRDLEKIISESQRLYSDIDCCVTELLKARTEHNSENEGKALFEMEGLMVSALQYLSWIKSGLPSYPTLKGRIGGDEYNKALSRLESLRISLLKDEIVELSFKGGTCRVDGEERIFKGGRAKIVILEINQEEESK